MSDRSTAPLAILVTVADSDGMVAMPLSAFSENRARAIEHMVREQRRENRGEAPTPTPPPPASGFNRSGSALPPQDRSTARMSGYTGDLCQHCQSDKMKRTGHCVTCDNCGANDGCS